MLWSYLYLAGAGLMLMVWLVYRTLLRQLQVLPVGRFLPRTSLLLCMGGLPVLAALGLGPRWLPLELPPLLAPAASLLLAYAVWLFWRSLHDVLLPPARLLQGGVYQRIRHPLYAALWLAALAQLLLLQDGVMGGAGILALLLSYGRSVRLEEGQMQQWFGDSYRQYMQRTGRLWPRGLAS